MFKTYKVYVQVLRNKITATDLETLQRVTVQADHPFSSVRQVLGTFQSAADTIQRALKDLGMKSSFSTIKMIVHQMEGTEGGLSDIEKRGLRDVAEISGAKIVHLVEQERALTSDEALQLIDSRK